MADVRPVPDFVVENHGTVFLFVPKNDKAAAFLRDSADTQPWQWMGGALAVEHRSAGYLADALIEEGFEVR